MYYHTIVKEDQFKSELDKIINMPISSIWLGIHNSLGLEIGELHEEGYKTSVKGFMKHEVGDWTLTISGKWYLSADLQSQKIIDTENELGLQHIIGLKVKDIVLDTQQHQVTVQLANNVFLMAKKSEWGLIGIVYNHKRYYGYNGQRFDEVRYPNK